MISRFKINGFKCFNEDIFELNDITILCGNNGAGKSSVIQALLLIRQAVENNSFIQEEHYNLEHWNNSRVFLNENFELALGITDEIYNEKATNNIEITLDSHFFKIPLPEENNTSDSVVIQHELLAEDLSHFLSYKEFYYLNAERIGPRYNSDTHYSNFIHCGHKGELTAQAYLRKGFYKVQKEKIYNQTQKDNFQIQVDEWLSYICSGTATVKVEPTSQLSSQIRLRNSKTGHTATATNIGFGISYLLPIIINGLIAEEGRVFIVENPEAHLHPKAQSNLGFFLGQLSTAGVKIIIETHSEHIINGIRRACLSENIQLNHEVVNIYFFKGFKEDFSVDYHLIKILKNGDLSDFPVDFFDQTRQDLFEILKLSQR